MNSYRHRNGGGLVEDDAAPSGRPYVSPDSFFDRDSQALGDTLVFSSVVTGGVLVDSAVSQASVHACLLESCTVAALADGKPKLEGVSLAGVVVEGGVWLRGPWEMNCPGAFIHFGAWGHPPRHKRVEGANGVSMAVSECVNGQAHIGCKCRPTSHWLERGPAVGRRFKWTEEQIEDVRVFLEGLK
jgi:hypothetical protein